MKSPTHPRLGGQKWSVPRLLGMYTIRCCYSELFGQFGPDLFDSPPPLKSAGPRWEKALSECHAIELLNEQGYLGKAKVEGRPVCIPAGSVKFISIVCPSSATTTLPSVLLEPLEGRNCLPPGVLISWALLTVNRSIVMPVFNAGLQDAWLKPNTPLG